MLRLLVGRQVFNWKIVIGQWHVCICCHIIEQHAEPATVIWMALFDWASIFYSESLTVRALAYIETCIEIYPKQARNIFDYQMGCNRQANGLAFSSFVGIRCWRAWCTRWDAEMLVPEMRLFDLPLPNQALVLTMILPVSHIQMSLLALNESHICKLSNKCRDIWPPYLSICNPSVKTMSTSWFSFG